MIAGYMAQNGDWRLCFWVTFAVQGLLLFYICLFFEESKYIPQLTGSAPDNRHAPSPAKSGTAQSVEDAAHKPESQADKWTSADCDLSADIPILTWKQKLRLFTKTEESLWRLFCLPFIILFQFPAVAYTSFQYAFTLCWISAQASIISIAFAEPPYNYGTIGLGNMNAPPFIGCILGAIYGGLISDRSVIWLSRRNYGYYEPEMRLHLLHLPALCLGAGFIMFGITTAKVCQSILQYCQQFTNHNKGMHWVYPSIGGAILGFGFGSNLDLSITVLVDSYQDVSLLTILVDLFFTSLTSVILS